MTEEREQEKEPGYTQKEWERVVGYGQAPDEYKRRLRDRAEILRRYEKG